MKHNRSCFNYQKKYDYNIFAFWEGHGPKFRSKLITTDQSHNQGTFQLQIDNLLCTVADFDVSTHFTFFGPVSTISI